MKKKRVIIFLSAVILSFLVSCTHTSVAPESATGTPFTATCYNGKFVGQQLENGVIAFKGIPFAKPPVGDLCWKAPVSPDADNEVYEAYDFSKTSIQYEWFSEPASFNEIGEDCLSLNDLYNMPLRDGRIIPENPYQALASGKGKDVILMTG